MSIRWGYKACIVACWLTAISLVLAADDSSNKALSAQLDSLFSAQVSARSPGVAVLVRDHGHTRYQRGFGVRDLRTSTAIDSKSDFRLASCTKQFTAMAIMLLVHDGKLKYEDKLARIFPEFPKYGARITIRNLLTHTSGLPDYEELMEKAEAAGAPKWSPTHQIQDREVLRLLEQQTSGKFAPGASWSYSNSGYVMLGLVVAKISGEPFERFLSDRIFVPLRMTNTLAFVNGQNSVPNRAYGHTKAAQGFQETDQSATSATLGDGGVYSNLEDLAKWDQALEQHSLLSEREMQSALTPATRSNGGHTTWPASPGDDNLAPGKPVSYGFGWFLDPYQGHPRMWHFGSTIGFRTAIERYTKDGLTVILLCNRTDLNPDTLSKNVVEAVWKTNPVR